MFNNRNQVSLIMGPMFSGKTDEMLRQIRRYTYLTNTLVCLFKTSVDNRTPGNIVSSRSGTMREATAQITSGVKAWEKVSQIVKENPGKSIVLGIDEGQFIEQLPYLIKKILEQKNVAISVYISALDSKFNGEMWEEIVNIIPLCSEVRKLTAICGICQTVEAQLTKRIVDSTEVKLIGSDQYVAACYNCYSL